MNRMEELLRQQQEISAAIAAEKDKNRQEAVETVKNMIAGYSITLREVKKVLVMRKPRTTKDPSSKTDTPRKPRRKSVK